MCLQRFESRQLYWLFAARIGAELLLRQKRLDEANRLFEAVVAAKTVPWARLGLARIHFAEGDIAKARHKVEALLGDEPNNADAYDVLGRVQMEQGQVDEARATFETVTKLTPDCILRLQHTGTLSFYAGDGERAAELLERAWTLGKKSRLFDFLSMLLLAFIRHDEKQTGALQIAMDNLSQAVARHPQSVRLRRFERIGIVLWDMTNGRNQRAFQIAREISSEFAKTTFDVEAAMSVLSMLSRLVQVGFPMDEFESIVRRLGQRFSVSRSANQMLLTAAQRRTDVEQWLADALVETSKVAQTGVDLSLQSELERAVEMLLQYGDLTYNARVIELAGQLLKRHGDKIPNLDQLVDTQGVLARRFCVPSTHIAGVRRSGRSSGGLLLRG
jgi:tetratricopeptide (TPR) repeat protein